MPPSPLNRPIGLFDSGLGGLTVLNEVRKRLPHEHLIYVGDTARVPYGTKSPVTIRRYAYQISFALMKKKVKALVVACNSMSAVALTALKKLPIPVLGVIVPGAMSAVASTREGRIGVIGTQATMESHAYRKEIKKRSPRSQVFEQACPLFVPLVESGWIQTPIATDIARVYLRPLLRKKIDTLVLGCTHYPVLKNVLKRVAGKNVSLIDSAEETANELDRLLLNLNIKTTSKRPGQTEIFVTDHPHDFNRIGHRFINRKIGSAKLINVDPS